MQLTLDELKRFHDKAYTAGQVNREKSSDDLVFYYITQWDDTLLEDSQLGYRGEFDLLRKAGREIKSDLAGSPVQVDFEARAADKETAGELLDGLYRSDEQDNATIDAYDNCSQEAIVCGVGAWLLYTEYETARGSSRNQVIKRRPIWEANNTCFFDPNAKMLDKSDMVYASVLSAYSEDGYETLVEELTGEEGTIESSFKMPEQSYVFPWTGGEGKKIYVVEFYHRYKVEDKHITLVDMMGQTRTVLESAMSEVMDDLIDAGYEIDEEQEKEIERWEVRKYIASGNEILNGEENEETGEREGEVIAGEEIPVVPMYGERASIEGEEHYEGITRLAKDPQRLRNFAMSYLADILSQSPREKPIFFQEQVAGLEHMYDLNGADNDYAYLLQNRLAGDGSQLPIGQVGTMPAPNIPPAIGPVIELTRQSVEDVANSGMPQNIADPDLSGKAVLALQTQIDKQSMVYQEHLKHAKRRDGVIYASMSAEIIDVPRTMKITLPDGTREDVEVMESVMDQQTGEMVVLNDIHNTEFDVYSKISASYGSQKEQTLERVEKLLQGINPADPKYNLLLLQYLKLMDGTDFDDIRDYANKEQLVNGFREPKNDEEKQMMAELSQRPQEPSAEMVLAQGELMKGQAALKDTEIRAFVAQSEALNKETKNQISGFEAQTDRMDTQIDAQEAGAKINNTNIESFGKELDNQKKVSELRQPSEMNEDELLQMLAG